MSRAQEIADLLSGVTITTADNNPQLTLESTDADANFGPVLKMHRNSSSPADSDFLGEIQFQGENDAGEAITYAQMFGRTVDVSDGTEDGRIATKIMIAGTAQNVLDIKNNEIVINDDSVDLDFRVESNGNANMFVVDGGTDKIGIGTAAPNVTVEMAAAVNGALSGVTNRNPIIQLSNSDTGYVAGNATAIDFATTLNYPNASIICRNDNSGSGFGGSLIFATSPTSGNSLAERVRIDNNGSLLVGTTSASMTGFDDARFRSHANGKTGIIVSEVFTDGEGIIIQGSSNSGNRNAIVFLNGGLGTVGSVVFSSSSTSYNTSSDYRLKENVADMTGAIDRVKALAPKRFNFIIDADTTVDGFLAHEAQTIVPEAVTGTKDGMRDEKYEITPAVLDDAGREVTPAKMGTRSVVDYQGIDQSKLVPLLTGALQEAIAKIETLEAKVTALEAG